MHSSPPPLQSAAPQLTTVTSLDSSSTVAVQLRVPDTNTPASPNTQQQRSGNNNLQSSEYSLFELETFFTRWAPDNYSVSAPAGPSCPLTTDDSAECDQDGVIIVETEPHPQHVLQAPQSSISSAVRVSGGQSFSSASVRSRVHNHPSVSEGKRLSPFPYRGLEMIPAGTGSCSSKSMNKDHIIQHYRGLGPPGFDCQHN